MCISLCRLTQYGEKLLSSESNRYFLSLHLDDVCLLVSVMPVKARGRSPGFNDLLWLCCDKIFKRCIIQMGCFSVFDKCDADYLLADFTWSVGKEALMPPRFFLLNRDIFTGWWDLQFVTVFAKNLWIMWFLQVSEKLRLSWETLNESILSMDFFMCFRHILKDCVTTACLLLKKYTKSVLGK